MTQMQSVTLRTDLWPATVEVNGDVLSPVRLFLSLDEIWVWQMVDGEKTLVINERVESVEGDRKLGWTVEMGDGRTLFFRRASGCGCGNPLRGFHPPFIAMQGTPL